ncbi:hypothetical protein KY321_02565, partial [Candidatus Woesearchaeota archaeon]|nr:hypothetical protein [Candidatus Woesearchaeota archaeon]
LKRDEVVPDKNVLINYETPSKLELVLHANKYEMMLLMFWDKRNIVYKMKKIFGQFQRPVKVSPCIPTNYQDEMKIRYDLLLEKFKNDDCEMKIHPWATLTIHLPNTKDEKNPVKSMTISRFNGNYNYNPDYREYS